MFILNNLENIHQAFVLLQGIMKGIHFTVLFKNANKCLIFFIINYRY